MHLKNCQKIVNYIYTVKEENYNISEILNYSKDIKNILGATYFSYIFQFYMGNWLN